MTKKTLFKVHAVCGRPNTIYCVPKSVCVWVTSLGSAGSPEGVSGEGDGGQTEADGDHQRHTEPAALSHAEGEGRVQPGAGRPAGERPAR